MAESKGKAEAAVLSVPAEYPDEPGQDPLSNLPTVEVSASDMPAPDPLHAGPEAVGASKDVFDPNAALRNKMGMGPGLQDSEAKNPAVWTELDPKKAREAAAKAEVEAAERVLERAKARAKAIKAGDPLDQEAGNIRG